MQLCHGLARSGDQSEREAAEGAEVEHCVRGGPC